MSTGQKIRFYLDEHVSLAIAAGLRRRGVEVLTVQDVGMLGKEDIEHLTFALQEGYVIVTQDAEFLRLHSTGIEHNGIVCGAANFSWRFPARIDACGSSVGCNEMKNHIEFIPLE
jgi:hypothetical protein